jgi:hypothetical protein
VTRLRLELLQWYALFGGALAWATQHVVGYFVSTAGCGSVGGNTTLAQVLLAVGAALLVLGAEAAAFTVFRATSSPEAPPPAGRLHFFAQAALLGNVLFLLVVVLDGTGSVSHLPCAQS